MSAGVPDAQRRARALVDELRALGSADHRAGMARFGIEVERACGVPIPVLRRWRGASAMTTSWRRRSGRRPSTRRGCSRASSRTRSR